MTDGSDGCGVVTDDGDGFDVVTDGGDSCGLFSDKLGSINRKLLQIIQFEPRNRSRLPFVACSVFDVQCHIFFVQVREKW